MKRDHTLGDTGAPEGGQMGHFCGTYGEPFGTSETLLGTYGAPLEDIFGPFGPMVHL